MRRERRRYADVDLRGVHGAGVVGVIRDSEVEWITGAERERTVLSIDIDIDDGNGEPERNA